MIYDVRLLHAIGVFDGNADVEGEGLRDGILLGSGNVGTI